jgi:futalosine hydrolase
MRVFITAATIDEWMPSFLEINPLYTSESKRIKVMFHQAGVGLLASTVSIMKLVYDEKPDLIIQVGIAGCFDASMKLGNVVAVKEDMLGDTGVEEEGRWKDIFDLKLEKPGYPPFEKKRLPNHHLEKYNLLKLSEVAAVTINEISTRQDRIHQLIKKYNPVTESMEGAALHYVCREMNIPFIQMRAISNYIGERDKTKWKMKEAIDNLNQSVLKYIDKLYKVA